MMATASSCALSVRGGMLHAVVVNLTSSPSSHYLTETLPLNQQMYLHSLWCPCFPIYVGMHVSCKYWTPGASYTFTILMKFIWQQKAKKHKPHFLTKKEEIKFQARVSVIVAFLKGVGFFSIFSGITYLGKNPKGKCLCISKLMGFNLKFSGLCPWNKVGTETPGSAGHRHDGSVQCALGHRLLPSVCAMHPTCFSKSQTLSDFSLSVLSLSSYLQCFKNSNKQRMDTTIKSHCPICFKWSY